MPQTYGYIRVSTAQQVTDDRASLEAQRRQISAAAAMANLPEPIFFEDPGVSGATPLRARPKGRLLMGLLEKGDTLIVAKLDRAFRSAADALDTVEKFKRDGIDLIVVQFGVEPVTTNGVSKMFFGMMALIAEFERSVIVERTLEGRRVKKARGGHIGGEPPYGWKKVGSGAEANLVPNETELATIGLILDLHKGGATVRSIAEHLRQANIRSRTGSYLDKTQVHRIVQRAVKP